jgi:hypothetical protein
MDFRLQANFCDEKIDLLSKHGWGVLPKGLDASFLISKSVKQIDLKYRRMIAKIGHQNQNNQDQNQNFE